MCVYQNDVGGGSCLELLTPLHTDYPVKSSVNDGACEVLQDQQRRIDRQRLRSLLWYRGVDSSTSNETPKSDSHVLKAVDTALGCSGHGASPPNSIQTHNRGDGLDGVLFPNIGLTGLDYGYFTLSHCGRVWFHVPR